MGRVLSQDHKRRWLRADLQHACLVMYDAEKKQGGVLQRRLLHQMIGRVMAFLRIGDATRQVGCGDYHSAVIDAGGRLRCFGNNATRQCEVPGLLGQVAQVAVGDSHTCAIDASRRLHCFGWNDTRQCDVPAGLGW